MKNHCREEICACMSKGLESQKIIERKERLNQQLNLIEHVAKVAQQIGVLGNLRILGGVAYPELRDYRCHGDVDVMMLGKKPHDALLTALVSGVGGICFEPYTLLPLRGSSMSYLHAKEFENAGPVELRFVQPTVVNGVEVGVHGVPFWVKPFLSNHQLVIPMSAFSHPHLSSTGQTIRIGETDIPFVYQEYCYLVKKSSKYPKDIADCKKLEEAGLNMLRLRQIQRDIRNSHASYLLPHRLMQIIRAFPIYGLGKEEYAELVAVPVKQKGKAAPY